MTTTTTGRDWLYTCPHCYHDHDASTDGMLPMLVRDKLLGTAVVVGCVACESDLDLVVQEDSGTAVSVLGAR